MSSKESPSLKRDNTMQATAKEGVQYLKDEGKQTLLKMQGLVDESGSDPAAGKPEGKLSKGTTMITTAKEGEQYIESLGGVDEDAKTRNQQEKIDKLKEDETSPAKKPRLSKDTTIHATAAEAKEILGSEKMGECRSQTKAIQEKPAPVPAARRSGTMEVTAKEGAEWVKRDSASENDDSPDKVKRSGTMQATAKEAEEWLNRKTDTSPPQVKRTTTMEATAKAGEEWVGRGTGAGTEGSK